MKNIVIWGLSVHRWLQMPLVKALKERQGAKIHFICGSSKDVEFWKQRDRDGVIDTYITTNHFFFEYDGCRGVPENVYRKARRYEEQYATFVVDALQADRHLGRGFYAGGIGHPRSELSDKADYVKSVELFNKIVSFWEDYFRKISPDLIIGVSASIVGKVCAAIARYNRIPIRVLVSAKYKAYYFWSVDEYQSCPGIRGAFESAESGGGVAGKDLEGGIEHPEVKTEFRRLLDIRSKMTLLLRILKQIKRQVYRRRHRIVSMGNYKLTENIAYLYRMHRDINTFNKLPIVSRERLRGLSYVFYPLHIEPETALGVFSPEFNEQMAAIELIAKNLPAGTVLAVKEHPLALGRRPKDFYQMLRDIPNVVIVPLFEHALSIARDARAVAVITSSLGTEAAIVGIPVISFGAHNNFNFLPHVYRIESWNELRPALTVLCATRPENTAWQYRQYGLRYLTALKAVSIDLNLSKYGTDDKQSLGRDETDLLYQSLVKTLNPGKITVAG